MRRVYSIKFYMQKKFIKQEVKIDYEDIKISILILYGNSSILSGKDRGHMVLCLWLFIIALPPSSLRFIHVSECYPIRRCTLTSKEGIMLGFQRHRIES